MINSYQHESFVISLLGDLPLGLLLPSAIKALKLPTLYM